MSHTSAVVGSSLYVAGTTTSSRNIEQAMIGIDGSLGMFAKAPISLVRARSECTTVVIGNSLYILGGIIDSAAVNGIEQAPLL